MSGLLWSDSRPDFELNPRKTRLVCEERANLATHGLGAVLALIGAGAVTVRSMSSQHEWLAAGCWIYAITLFSLYLTSALSHCFLRGRVRHTFRTLDQVCIFLFAAGNFTPAGLMIVHEGGSGLVLAGMWVLALSGVAAKLFVTGIRNVPVIFYIGVGWMPGFALWQMAEFLPPAWMTLVLGGAGLYMLGTFFYLNDLRYAYFHAVWHVLVMAGAVAHFAVIYSFLIPIAG